MSAIHRLFDYLPQRGAPLDARRLVGLVVICFLAWLAIAAAAMTVGTVSVGWPADAITRGFRFELVVMASIVGASLAAGGVVYQAVLRNPLADPYLLGISGGASLAAYLWQIPAASMAVSAWLTPVAMLGQQAAAFIGALAAVVAVLLLSSRRGRLDPVVMLLVGVIVSVLCGAMFMLVNALRPELVAGAGGPMRLLVGGLQTGISAAQWGTALGILLMGWAILLPLSSRLNIATLSDDEAVSLGLRIHRLRWTALAIASLITAAAVAISGPIGFVGLICPHVGRMIVGPDNRRLLPVATALGAILLVLADTLTRGLSGSLGTILPVGVLTSLIGGPVFLALLARNARRVI